MTGLTSGELTAHDPLLRLLRRVLGRRHDLWIVLVTALLMALVLLGLPRLLGDQAGPRDYVRTTRGLLLVESFFVVPLVVGIYLWLPRAAAALARELRDGDVIDPAGGPFSYEAFENDLRARAGDRRWTVAAAGAAVAGAAYELLVEYPAVYADRLHHVYADDRWPLAAVFMVGWLVGGYTVTLNVVRLFALLWLLDRLFGSCQVNVHPLHLDRVGGLGPIGRFATTLLIVAALLGGIAVVSAALFQRGGASPLQQLQLLVLVTLYAVLVPALFHSLVWRPHRRMAEVRDRQLSLLSDEFDRCLASIGAAQTRRPGEVVAATARLRRTREQYQWVKDAFPTWPIPLPLLGQWVGTALLPLLVAIIPVVPILLELVRRLTAR